MNNGNEPNKLQFGAPVMKPAPVILNARRRAQPWTPLGVLASWFADVLAEIELHDRIPAAWLRAVVVEAPESHTGRWAGSTDTSLDRKLFVWWRAEAGLFVDR